LTTGKGHLGYQTTDHLPFKRGFDHHYGFLQGDQQYEHGLAVMCDVPQLLNLPIASWCGQWPPRTPKDKCNLDFWQQNSTAPQPVLDGVTYSTTAYAAQTIHTINAKRPNEPLFIYLAWQAVHGPWVLPDVPNDQLLQPSDAGYANYCCTNSIGNECLPLPSPTQQPDKAAVRTQVMRCQFGSMLKVLDAAMANITAALKAKDGLWENTLMLVMSDNGGVGQ
jgi:arylsulfatase A-like enzyme